MPISTRDVASTAGTKTLLTSDYTTRLVIKTSAAVEIFGNVDDANGFPFADTDGEFNFEDLKPSDNIYVDGLATINVLDQTSK